jgi:hypothetical protein
MSELNKLITTHAESFDHGVYEFKAGVKFGMELAAQTVQTHQCQELRTCDCTCIHDGDAAAKVIKKKMEELND